MNFGERESTNRLPGRSGWRGQRGFSLVELVIALQFAAVVAFMTAPTMGAFLNQYQLMGATNQLGFDIARAKMQAVGQNRWVRIRMLNGTQYASETSADGATWSNQVKTKLPGSVTVTTTSAKVQFDRHGYATVNNTFTLKNGLQQLKSVATSVIGRVTIVGATG